MADGRNEGGAAAEGRRGGAAAEAWSAPSRPRPAPPRARANTHCSGAGSTAGWLSSTLEIIATAGHHLEGILTDRSTTGYPWPG